MIRSKVEHFDRRARIGEQLQELLGFPVLERVEGGITDRLVFVSGEKDKNLDLLIEGKSERALGTFAADEFRGAALAE